MKIVNFQNKNQDQGQKEQLKRALSANQVSLGKVVCLNLGQLS
jgi:hypothetical protein